jgi:hypothetical protein
LSGARFVFYRLSSAVAMQPRYNQTERRRKINASTVLTDNTVTATVAHQNIVNTQILSMLVVA